MSFTSHYNKLMSFTYAQLKTAIQDYTDNETTFVNHLNDFIKNAEERIFKSVDLDFFRKNVTSSMTSSDQFLTIPSDYLASFSLQMYNFWIRKFSFAKRCKLFKRVYSSFINNWITKILCKI